MREFLYEQDSASLLTTVKIGFLQGALAEPRGKEGLAQLAWELLLRSSKAYPGQKMIRAIEELGAEIQFGVEYDRVVAHVSVIHQNLEAILPLLYEMFSNFEPTEEEFLILQQAAIGEMSHRYQDAEVVAGDVAMLELFQGTRAERPISGQLDSLKGLQLQDVFDFQKKLLQSSEMVIGVVSPLSRDEFESLWNQHCPLQGVSPTENPSFPSPQFEHSRGVWVEKKALTTVPLYFVTPGVESTHPQFECFEVLNFIFGGDFTARLSRVLRIENGWTYGAYSGFEQLLSPRKTTSLFSFYTFPDPSSLTESLPRAVSLFLEFVQKGVTSEELENAKKSLINSYPFRMDTARKRLSRRFREKVTGRRFLSEDEFREKISALSVAEANQLITDHWGDQPFLLTAVGDPTILPKAFSKLSDEVKTLEWTRSSFLDHEHDK